MVRDREGSKGVEVGRVSGEGQGRVQGDRV